MFLMFLTSLHTQLRNPRGTAVAKMLGLLHLAALAVPAVAGNVTSNAVAGNITSNALASVGRHDPWAPVAFANLTFDCAVTISGVPGSDL